MLLTMSTLTAIRDGSVDLVFRHWKRPTVRTGGTLRTALGELEIRSVAPVDAASVSDADARRAGFESRSALLNDLPQRPGGTLYRIELGALRPDPREALRDSLPDARALATLHDKLRRMDARAAGGPWTTQVLALLAARPAVRAGDLCEEVGQDKPTFKANVRKLKNLGLTESLGTGYRLSPRGEAVLASLEA